MTAKLTGTCRCGASMTAETDTEIPALVHHAAGTIHDPDRCCRWCERPGPDGQDGEHCGCCTRWQPPPCPRTGRPCAHSGDAHDEQDRCRAHDCGRPDSCTCADHDCACGWD